MQSKSPAVFAILAALAAASVVAHDKDKGKGHGPRLRDATTFGPVALAPSQGLRVCHANHFDRKPVGVEWAFLAVAPTDPMGGGAADPTQVVGRMTFELPPQTGGCADFLPAVGQVPEGSSIIAILIGLVKPGHTADDLIGSAQLFDQATGGAPTFGALLPAQQKVRVFLPAVP